MPRALGNDRSHLRHWGKTDYLFGLQALSKQAGNIGSTRGGRAASREGQRGDARRTPFQLVVS